VETTWFALLCFMMTVYVVLDGFDFGVGILHLFVARSDDERRTVIASIGPVWNGNEVWLVAFGGVLLFSFPAVYAAALSGFYLPLMLVLWLLILRGMAIEFRSQIDNPLWRALWDAVFAVSSSAMAAVLGVALGNVLRGVPIGEAHQFHVPFFTSFTTEHPQGALDWFTVLVGFFALLVLAGHGAAYLNWKTAGPVQARSQRVARVAWSAVAIVGVAVTIATARVQPVLYTRLWHRPATWPLPFWIAGSLVALGVALRRGQELRAFLASSAFIAGMLAATAAGLYPDFLRSTVDETWNLTVHNAAAGRAGLVIGLAWWIPALVLAAGYFAYLFRAMSGKVKGASSQFDA
jgi:cytochrome d ubiquinol oxidase subunit II